MKLQWTESALADRRSIFTYIDTDNPNAAAALDGVFEARADRLKRHPELGRPGRMPGTRELVVHRNYVLVYDLAERKVRILRVLHTALQWPPGPDEGQA